MKPIVQKTLLWMLVASLAMLATAVVLMVGGVFPGRLNDAILTTTLIVTGATACLLVGALLWERRALHPSAPIGIALVIAAVIPSQLLVWDVSRWDARAFEIMAGVGWIMGASILAVGMMSLAQLRGAARWARILTTVSLVSLDCISLYLIIGQPRWPFARGYEQWTMILIVTTLVGFAAVAILHRISKLEKRATRLTTGAGDVSLQCPRCGAIHPFPIGHGHCAGCGLRIYIEIDEELCPKCGYSLYRLESGICPECGTPVGS